MDSCGFITIDDDKPIGFLSWDLKNLLKFVVIGHNCNILAHQGLGKGSCQLMFGVKRIMLKNPK
jgi:hypothetical protein